MGSSYLCPRGGCPRARGPFPPRLPLPVSLPGKLKMEEEEGNATEVDSEPPRARALRRLSADR